MLYLGCSQVKLTVTFHLPWELACVSILLKHTVQKVNSRESAIDTLLGCLTLPGICGEIPRKLERFFWKHEDPSLISIIHVKRQDVVILALERQRQGDP